MLFKLLHEAVSEIGFSGLQQFEMPKSSFLLKKQGLCYSWWSLLKITMRAIEYAGKKLH